MSPKPGPGPQSARFNSFVLFLLTFQSAGATILATLTQRGVTKCPASAPLPELALGEECKYSTTHLLATAELFKFLASLLWCAVEVYAECTTVTAAEDGAENAFLIENTTDSNTVPSRGDSEGRSSAESEVENSLQAPCPLRQEDSNTNTTSSTTDPGDHTVCKSRSKQVSLPTTRDRNGEKTATTTTHFASAQEPDAKDVTVVPAATADSLSAASARHSVGAAAPSFSPSVSFWGNIRSTAFLRHYTRTMRAELGLTSANVMETFVMVIPAVLYAVQNNMVLVALEVTDPAVFQILYLIRILFLAVLMRIALNLQLTTRQCVALVLLTVGIGMAQWKPSRGTAAAATNADGSAVAPTRLLLIIAAALISSGTGVFLEVVFKKRGNHFHLSARNVHLALFSMMVFACKFVFEYRSLAVQLKKNTPRPDLIGPTLEVYLNTFFRGFTALVWCLVLMQSVAGILLALVMKYSNNIMKTFSTSLALLISMAASVTLFGTTVQPQFVVGAVLVVGSVVMYNRK